jgi:TetR/AcrR family transcriptional regulator, tetracycline repressor protein
MGRPKQPLISRRKTLEVALRIIDQDGLDGLSIRRLGDQLNVRGISLYHHFPSKEHILIGACELALVNVRTPNTSNIDWREWLVRNSIEYWRALRRHPNLIPILMRRHPLRIGLSEHNATAGLLAVQGVPPGAIMPLLEGLESLALGCAAYESAVASDTTIDNWQEQHPFLYRVSISSDITRAKSLEVMAHAIVKAILGEFENPTGPAIAEGEPVILANPGSKPS